MIAFLKSIAEQLHENYGQNISEIAIVTPTKRAGLFLRKYLAQTYATAFIAPKIFTLPEFIGTLASKNKSSKLDLLLLLYRVYKKRMEAKAETFEVFSKWASTALSDFSDIEQSLVNGKSLFRDLRDIKEIENWSFNQNPLSEVQNEYLEFWNQLALIYSDFRSAQLNEEKYSYALLCNLLATNTPSETLDPSISKIWFVGLSNLSKAENKILEKLVEAGKAKIIWDADEYYYNNSIHEAGAALRTTAKKNDILFSNNLLKSSKAINTCETTTPYSQTLYTRDLIAKLNPEDIDETAIVLADQSLLLPLLKNLPPIENKINIALGYPLKQTAAFKLIKSLLQLHIPIQGKEKRGTYFKHFFKVIEQQSLADFIHTDLIEIRKAIANEKRIYFRGNQLLEFVEQYSSLQEIKFIFNEENRTSARWIKNTIQLLDVLIVKSKDEFETEALLRTQDILAEILNIVNENPDFEELKSLQVFLQHFLAQEAITFTGEPLEGLQILNMVETRALDFKHVIIIGANEDLFPGNLQEQSLIPFDLRKIFELPTIIDKEATYGYTLYRLLQRAEHVTFLYSSITSDFKGTERSRYITQLELELCAANKNIQFSKISVALLTDANALKEVEILNDNFARERVQKLWENGISPSALNKYLQCPLDFYYRYILGLGEEETVEENISAATFGSAVHEVLEKFFEKYIQSFPSKEDLIQFKSELSPRLREAFKNNYGSNDLDYGENYLQFSLALTMLETIVDFELKELEYRLKNNISSKIIGIESKFEATIQNQSLQIPFTLKIKGKADRVDEENGIVRIIDYKTGKVESKDVNITKPIAEYFEGTNSKMIQLLFYTLMLSANGYTTENIRAALFSLKNFSSGWQYLGIKEQDGVTEEIMNEFKEQLILSAKSMLETVSFKHNPDSLYCEYCNR